MLKNALLFLWQVFKIVVLALLIVLPIRYFIFQPFIVKGISMEPNFHNNDYLIIDEISYRFRAPERGEIVVFNYPLNPSEKFIKRIIGLPGETVELSGGQITIVDRTGRKKILDESSYLSSEQMSFKKEKITLNQDQYFVMGDNRFHSFDSRSWGVLPKSYIVGRVLFRAFPPKEIKLFLSPSY